MPTGSSSSTTVASPRSVATTSYARATGSTAGSTPSRWRGSRASGSGGRRPPPGALEGTPPLLDRQEASRGPVDRVQARRAEGLHEIEDELRVDRLPRVG